jgi:hypothetical protein
MAATKPTDSQLREAQDGVASRGWARSKAAHHDARPNGIREDHGTYHPCEHCHAKTNPARWPLFFRVGEHAGQLLWTCSTCKIAQADRQGAAVVLVEAPRI